MTYRPVRYKTQHFIFHIHVLHHLFIKGHVKAFKIFAFLCSIYSLDSSTSSFFVQPKKKKRNKQTHKKKQKPQNKTKPVVGIDTGIRKKNYEFIPSNFFFSLENPSVKNKNILITAN